MIIKLSTLFSRTGGLEVKELAEAPIVYIFLPLPKSCYLWYYYLHSAVWHRLLKLIQGVIDYDNCKGIAKEFDMGISPYR